MKDGSCVDAGMLIMGAGSLEMTSVAFRVVEPVLSLAINSIGTPVTVSLPASLVEGVPDKVRLLLSSDNQVGALDREYCIGRSDEKVESENVYKKGFETLATGGT